MPASSLPHFAEMSLRARLIAIFIAIKVLPLLLLALFAWQAATDLGRLVTLRAVSMADVMLDTQRRTGATAIGDAIEALDDRAREAIEALTTDVAREVARFLYDRDQDILRAARIPPAADAYRRFLDTHLRLLEEHAPYALDVDGTRWVEADPAPHRPALVRTPLPDNAGSFHYRTPDPRTHQTLRPLFLEMSFIDLDGHERIKVHSDRALGLLDPALHDIRDPAHTFVRAETYWPALKALRPGEIHVSRVIGAQVRTHWIGDYTPARAQALGKPFAPADSGYAGLENPVGRRFQGLIRWAAPVLREGRLTLVLADPFSPELADDMRRMLAVPDLEPALALPETIVSAINHAFGEAEGDRDARLDDLSLDDFTGPPPENMSNRLKSVPDML